MRQDDWIERLQKRMAGHEEPVGDDLWAGIEQALDQRKVVGTARKAVAWRRYAAAAAIIAALMGGAGYVLMHQQEPACTPVALMETGSESSRQLVAVRQEMPAARVGTSARQLMAKANQSSEKCVDMLDTHAQVQPEAQTDVHDALPSVQDVEHPSHKVDGATEVGQGEPVARRVVHKRNGYARVSMRLYAANSLGGYSGSNGLSMPRMMATALCGAKASQDLLYVAAPSPMLAQTHEEIEHHQPVSFGLTAGYAINHRWTLTSGVVYTKLTSDFIQVMGENRLSRRQTLQYVGVPLNVSCMVWGSGRLRTYVTAGGQADFNVDAKTVKEGVNHDMPSDKVQFSALAAGGIQVDLAPQIGVYVEPGARYYFDNHSDTRNFFKDKPLSFSLQVGVRWNVR